jgi:hypothetical protein
MQFFFSDSFYSMFKFFAVIPAAASRIHNIAGNGFLLSQE